ncbi:peptidylprolyl isomerase [Candidatus Daviesbacteria bacterium RIFCSPLOWO2_02_FULL_41_8]|uniref:Peptidyl-prolyl cis-trans isomerase n=2 Tax=Candidatus Daviesiibacteriota TaxID=1752718 RepID=A0A1F5NID9_9BACT|nr:MAG: peptidylprolyl isomerase [Candidatus Daviesbacteria bacterium RIFCSPHIGHO2_02_FULL_41_10]OGE77437.1 MAG: peptidylprolyl isomerase [Candidatus Daviesbacteria bacterium RIFCSPLOWO2_02_FULL_41_8]
MKKIVYIGIVVLLVAGIIYTLTKGKKEENVSTQDSNIPITQASPSATSSAELKIEDIKEGTGSAVKSGDIITIHYSGTLLNGTKFDSSYDRGQPFQTQIGVGQVIKGWDQGLIGMKVGGKRKLTIPPDLAYGERGAGAVIPPNATLIFDLELLDIK